MGRWIHSLWAKASPNKFTIEAKEARKAGNLAAADEAIAEGRKLFPNDMRLRLEAAQNAMARKNWEEAVQRWESIIDLGGNQAPPRAYIGLIRAHRARKDFRSADSAARRARMARPEHRGLAIEYAQQAMIDKAWPEAVSRWQSVKNDFRNDPSPRVFAELARVYRNMGDIASAESTILEGGVKYPNDALLMTESAHVATARKDWQEAISRWKSVVDKEKMPAGASVQLGRAYRAFGDLAAAERVVKEALAAHPENPGLDIELAEISVERKDWREAAERWRSIIAKLDEEAPAATYRGLARALYYLGESREADVIVRRGLELFPTHKGLLADESAIGYERHTERVAARTALRTVATEPSARPLVSIIVLTRDGKSFLDAMFRSFLATNSYPSFEFIVVDHASTDRTAELLERWKRLLPIRVLAYDTNNSFSFANNRAAEIAEGSLLLLLNNDIIFTEDVIGRMVAAIEDDRAGVVGLKQYPGSPFSALLHDPYHIGIRFAWDEAARFLRPINVSPGATDDLISVSPVVFPAVTGSCLLCRRSEYLALGGLNEGYVYGYEDVDFCLKVRVVLGKEVLSLNDVSIHHNERSTRRKESDLRTSERGLNNTEQLKARFGSLLRTELRNRIYRDDGSITGKRFTAGIAVTSTDSQQGAGDLFTALGLGRALQRRFNWAVHYLAEPQCYNAQDLDLLIAMRDDTDFRRLTNAGPNLVKIAWIRNWFDRWTERPWFDSFDLLLASSVEGARFVSGRTGRRCEVLPIGVAPGLFNSGPPLPDYEADYVFTGSNWNPTIPRDIEAFDPASLPYRYAIYGKNWQDHTIVSRSFRGFVPYEELPRVYNSAKLTVDDTAHHARPWGSVNSRVFEALAAGSLVLTNNAIGSKEMFQGRLPVWNNVEELKGLLDLFLRDEARREDLLRDLREEVLSKHTYDSRAETFFGYLADHAARLRIAIKCPVPHHHEASHWGDYHFAQSLAKSLNKLGHQVRIDLLPEWRGSQALADDVAIVLRGLSAYQPSSDQINICWLISHPTKVSDSELEHYDHVFVASLSYAKELAARLSKPVTPLLQCSDPEIFHPPDRPAADSVDLLFVGNSRMQRRKIVDDALKENLPIVVYGREWEGLIDNRFIRGTLIENDKLHAFYHAAKIVLNDHWPDMAQHGFVSNRIFDVALSGGFVLSDQFVGSDLFGDAVATYDGPPHLRQLYEEWHADDVRRLAAAERLRRIVLAGHTFDHRARVMNDVIETLLRERAERPKDRPLVGVVQRRAGEVDSATGPSSIAVMQPDASLIVHRPPRLERYYNAFATPSEVAKEGELRHLKGAVYSEQGDLVRLSQRASGFGGDIVRNDDPPTFSGEATQTIPGRGLYIGHLFAHYGHFITEGLGSVWAAVAGSGEFDYLAAHPFIFGSRRPPYAKAAFEMLGIDDSKIYIIHEPTRFQDLTVAERLWATNHSVNAAFSAVVDRLARDPVGPGERFYLSRRHVENRAVSNESQIEVIFERQGFRVVHPERLSFSEQLDLCARASVLAGFAGSQLHNVLFCRQGTSIVLIGDGLRPQTLINNAICAAIRSSATWHIPFSAEGEGELATLYDLLATLSIP